MAKQTKPFILEIKNARRTRTRPAEPARSIWGNFASDLKQNLAEEENEATASKAMSVNCPEPSDLEREIVAEHNEAPTSPSTPQFLEKWSAKRAERPKAGSTDIVAAFLRRIEQQKALLAEFEADPAGFASWRSAWFRKVPSGFGVSIGHDLIDAGEGLRYVVVDTLRDVSEFFDDLGHHAQTDINFQRALKENSQRRARRRDGARAQ